MPDLDLHVVLKLLGALLALGFWCGVFYVIYRSLSAPLRRRERTALLLDLVETSLRHGHTPERALLDLYCVRDKTFGRGLRRVAQALDRGLHLGEALLGAPGFITPQVADMLRVGERTGTLPAVLPVCRQSLHDTSSRVLSGVNYLVVILMFVSPAGLAVGPFLSLMILPKFIEIMRDIAGDAPLPAFLQLLHLHWREIVVAQVGVIVALVAGAVFYALGPRLFGWLPELQALCDRWTWRLPWKRQRALRDFSATLAVLLDAGLPEDRALTLAAECADQTVLRHRTADIIADLRNGARLTDAVAVLDRTGEFRWRLTNAAHGATGFRAALAGWHETLAARAFQQEQVVSQLITTALVLVNATLVAALAIGVFQCLATIMGGAGIW